MDTKCQAKSADLIRGNIYKTVKIAFALQPVISHCLGYSLCCILLYTQTRTHAYTGTPGQRTK